MKPKRTHRKPIPQTVRFNVLRRDDFRCRYCGRQSPDVVLHCDHVDPVSNGGLNNEDNLITACSDCNFGKQAKVGIKPPVTAPASADTSRGLFGHTLLSNGDLDWQFQLLLPTNDVACRVERYSWLSGEPTDVVLIPTATLTDPAKTRLYADEASWLQAAERFSRDLLQRQRESGHQCAEEDEWIL